MPVSTTLYERLGVPISATTEDVKRAYRKLAVQHHPDKGGDPDTFRSITEAYEVLREDGRRRFYDQMGDAALTHMAQMDSGGAPSPFMSPFANMFPTMRSSRRVPVSVPVRTLYADQVIRYRLKRRTFAAATTPCPACRGAGAVTQMSAVRGVVGRMMMQRRVSCEPCQGSGVDAARSPHEVHMEVVDIAVPRGCPNGHVVVCPDKMDVVSGRPGGDVHFVIEHDVSGWDTSGWAEGVVAPNGDVFVRVTVTLREAVVGFVRHARLPNGESCVVVPSRDGSSVLAQWKRSLTSVHRRVRGKGLSCDHDLVVRIDVMVEDEAWDAQTWQEARAAFLTRLSTLLSRETSDVVLVLADHPWAMEEEQHNASEKTECPVQ